MQPMNQPKPSGMRAFLVVRVGQAIFLLRTGMYNVSLTIWAIWQVKVAPDVEGRVFSIRRGTTRSFTPWWAREPGRECPP